MVVLVVLPVVVTLSGVRVIVQLPPGNPFNTTLPVGVVQVGCVIVPTIGAVGLATTVKLLLDVQPLDVSVKLKVTVPALTPETTPVFVTVAVPELLLVQVPPEVGVTVAVLPTHTSFAPPNVGLAFTVKLLLDVHPVEVSVKVKLTIPALIPLTTPVFDTVAMPGLLLIHVPPVVGVTVAELPIHTSFAPPKTGFDATAWINTFALDGDTQPFELTTEKV
jgi:hypothetical protein